MAASAGRPARICDQCVGLCVDILDEDYVMAHCQADPVLPDPTSASIDELVRAAIESARAPHKRYVLECSFCDAPQSKVAKLIAGPSTSTYICDGCIVDAATIMRKFA